MKNITEVRWHGRGGQGAKSAAQFLAEAALDSGKYIQAFPEYGPERAGAPIRAYTRISDNVINIHSSVTSPDVVVVIDSTLITPSVLEGLPKEGVLVVNSPDEPDVIRKNLSFKGGKVATVDATKIALETIKAPMPNTPMLGALLKTYPIVSLDALESKIRDKFLKKIGEEKTAANIKAIKRAYEEVKLG
ncbi:MAG: 2-oxoacid:acceptor oxidoreductase family protein [Candidatus Omnitrophica bacterium]|nr:2-oxoacid:acceptor oxidoreductase family protein [Candidatus Omnitrophota bacterium]